MLLVLGLVLFVLLIVVHEYGHFLAAKRNGVEVEEFGIGFPPKIVGKKMGKGIFEGYYTLNLLPLGGFVKLKGESDADTAKGSLGAASLKVKTKIMLAGVVMNFLAAAVIFTILAVVGMPRVVPDQFAIASDTKIRSQKVLVGLVGEGSPAEKAGLNNGDQIVSIANKPVDTAENLIALTEEQAGNEVNIEYRRGDDTVRRTTAQLNPTGEDGHLGVVPAEAILESSTWSAPIRGLGLAVQFTALTAEGLWTTLTTVFAGNFSEASDQVGGPVMIYSLLADGSLIGYQFVLLIVAILSITLAVMNSLPIPGLDGGRLALILLFRAMKKKLTTELEQKIVGAGMVFLISLIILITVVDIRRFF